MQQGISNPEFYGDLVYKFKKIIGNPNFSDIFRRIVKHFRRTGYNLDIMRQTACLDFNPIMVDDYAALFRGLHGGGSSLRLNNGFDVMLEIVGEAWWLFFAGPTVV